MALEEHRMHFMLVELGLEVEELERVVQKEREDDRELEMEEEAFK